MEKIELNLDNFKTTIIINWYNFIQNLQNSISMKEIEINCSFIINLINSKFSCKNNHLYEHHMIAIDKYINNEKQILTDVLDKNLFNSHESYLFSFKKNSFFSSFIIKRSFFDTSDLQRSFYFIKQLYQFTLFYERKFMRENFYEYE